ncbi:uncharacterized protein LOC142100711 [Mixophyes fleayi]|uniref:uncharacterized protein LOC142100711 n=1 Tax=Mixophyes fleayi TaxID=3061075 RepID=UPI003F4DE7F5
MLINMNMGSKDSNSVCDHSPVQFNDIATSEKFIAPKIPAPPPPPPPITTLSEPPSGLLQNCNPKQRSRLRNFNWEAIPPEKVKGRSSLWSTETLQGDLQLDTRTMEELFGKQEEVQLRHFNPRRSISLGDTHMNKVFLLDSRKSMNIGIFLKQCKRSAEQIVKDIKMGNGDMYTSERLHELLKHLPDREEVQRLKSFQGDKERLSEVDLFMLLLLELPSYCLHLEALILKKDFHPTVQSQLSAAIELKAAAEELLQCSELHFILKLVLKAGNFMNAGGYAGNAAGFRMSSLNKLADTKANKPGMNLLHFVVMEVQKKNPRFLSFADRLKHVHKASRLSEDGLVEELYRLQSRVTSMHQTLASPQQQELRQQMDEFLEYAHEKLQEVQKEIDALQSSTQNLLEFLCEDEDTFRLEECCKIFSCFCQKFQLAIKENKDRELEEQRRQEWEKNRLQRRHSMATCGALEPHQAMDELELTLERNLRNTCRPLGVRLCRIQSLGSNRATSSIPCSVQRKKIQEYCDQKNADQMREVSERVLRQQMEYKNRNNVYTGNKRDLYPMSVTQISTSCQPVSKADFQKPSQSLPKDGTEISQLSLGIHGSDVSEQLLSHPGPLYSEEQQNINQLQVQCIPELLDSSLRQSYLKCPIHTKIEVDTLTQPNEQPFLLSQLLDHSETETSGQSKTLCIPEMPRQSFTSQSLDHLIPETLRQSQSLDGPEIHGQSSSQFTCQFPKESLSHSGPKATSPLIFQTETEIPCQISFPSESEPTIHPLLAEPKHNIFIQLPSQSSCGNSQDLLAKYGPGTISQVSQSQSKFTEPSLCQPGSDTVKPIPVHSNPEDITESLTQSDPACITLSSLTSKTQSQYHSEIEILNNPSDFSISQNPKQLPAKYTDENRTQTLDQSDIKLLGHMLYQSAPETFKVLENHAGSDTHLHKTHKQSLLQSGYVVSIQSVDQPESKILTQLALISVDHHRSATSLQILQPNELENTQQLLVPHEPTSYLQTLAAMKTETVSDPLVHPQPETLKHSESPIQYCSQSTVKNPKQSLPQSTTKTFKQTLLKSTMKNPKQSLTMPGCHVSSPSLIPSRVETSNKNETLSKSETPRLSLSQPGCFMSRIKHVEHLAVKQQITTKEINGHIPPTQEKIVDPLNETSRGLQPRNMGYSLFAKGPKDVYAAVQRETLNPCSKWKRELENTSERGGSGRVESKIENSSVENDRNSSEHKSRDNLKNAMMGRNGSSIPKKSKHNDMGIRRVSLTKDLAPGSTSPSVIKQPISTCRQVQKETRDNKIPQKVSLYSAGSIKPTSGKVTGSFKEKKESPHANKNEFGKSESKCSPLVTSKYCIASPLRESPRHGKEHVRESAWTSQTPPKKSSSVAKVAIHVIKHCEVNSALTRGSRNPYLDTHPIWR